MIGGIIILLVAIWMYQAAIQAKKENIFLWVAIGAVTFFVVQMLLVKFNVFILESMKESQGPGIIDDSGFSGYMFSAFLELMPPIGGIIGAAFVRTIVLLKLKPTPANLASGFMDMIKGFFKGIKESFKTSGK